MLMLLTTNIHFPPPPPLACLFHHIKGINFVWLAIVEMTRRVSGGPLLAACSIDQLARFLPGFLVSIVHLPRDIAVKWHQGTSRDFMGASTSPFGTCGRFCLRY
jgi:hypothetical protein